MPSLKYKTRVIALLAILFSVAGFAGAATVENALLQKQGLLVRGNWPVKLVLNNGETKIIRLMNIQLSKKTAQQLTDNLSYLLKHPMKKNRLQLSDLPPQKYNGMNGEPVLDQGEWGTCATFAVTGAINALYPLLHDASISQLCNLEFSRTLDSGSSGAWDGSFGYIVLDQISNYGYIDFHYQTQVGCGGLKKYPAYSGNNGLPMPLTDFAANSHHEFTDKDWVAIWKYDGHFSPLDPETAEKALAQVKTALNSGYRVVFGTLLDGNVNQIGALGTYDGVSYDTWVMTPEIQRDIQNGVFLDGHEIIIDGYDDNACATYNDEQSKTQKQQCGLLRIRNSWSDQVGDQGDYYMSYDHFKGMAIEVYAIGQHANNANSR